MSMASTYAQAADCLTQLMPLMEAVWLYPFAMSLHETDNEEEIGEAITGAYGGDVYFPGFFRPVLSSQPLLSTFANYTRAILDSNLPYEQVRQPLTALIKIIGRLCAASAYSFKHDHEKLMCRECGVEALAYVCGNFKYFE